eukprot:2764252-Rhodomonas_salina.1
MSRRMMQVARNCPLAMPVPVEAKPHGALPPASPCHALLWSRPQVVWRRALPVSLSISRWKAPFNG